MFSMFNLYCVTLNEYVMLGDNKHVFISGLDAKVHGDYLANITGYKYQPRPAVSGDNDWKQREANRFENGDYKRVTLLEERGLTIDDHFVHYSTKTCSDLAYTKNEEKGRLDLQTKTSLAGYLEVFFSAKVSPKEIRELSEQNELLFLNDEVKFAITPDEIERVYTRPSESNIAGANSCMRSPARQYTDNVHPTRVYGAGDLAVAYLTDEDNRVTDRALCWPDRKIYSRVYGKANNLHTYLKKLGFKKSLYYGESKSDEFSFDGAKLLAIPVKRDPESYIVPYIDELDVNLAEQNGFLVFSKVDGNINTRNTNGRATKVPFLICKFCGATNLESKTFTFYTDTLKEGSYSFTKCCEKCAKTHGYNCEGLSCFVDKEKFGDPVRLEAYNYNLPDFSGYEKHHNTVSNYWLSTQVSYQICQFDPKFASTKSSSTEVIVDELGTTQFWAPHSVFYHSVVRSGKRYAKTVKLPELVRVVTDYKKRMVYSSWTAERANTEATLTKLYGRKAILICNELLKSKRSFFDLRMRKPPTIIEQMREAA